MKLRDVALLADESIHPAVTAFLSDTGCNVLAARNIGLTGAADITIMRRAFADGRVIITHDSDFGALAISAHEAMIGIVYLRPGHIDAAVTIRTMQLLLDRDFDVRPPFIMVARRTKNRVRIRVRAC